jgi:predicted  nucleic acid-binding Zn-ribbon protein
MSNTLTSPAYTDIMQYYQCLDLPLSTYPSAKFNMSNTTDQIINTSITALKQQLEIANNKLVAAKWEVKRIEKALKAFEAQVNDISTQSPL